MTDYNNPMEDKPMEEYPKIGFFQILILLFTNPFKAFKYIDSDNLNNKYVTYLLLINGLLSSSAILSLVKGFTNRTSMGILIGFTLGIPLTWLFYNVLSYISSLVAGYSSEYGNKHDFLKVLLFSNLPLLIIQIITIFIFLPLSFVTDFYSLVYNSLEINPFFYKIIQFFSYLINVWALILSTIGTSTITKLSTTKALFRVVIPVLILSICFYLLLGYIFIRLILS